MDSNVALLRNILGNVLSKATAHKMLTDAGGCIETAVAMHFSEQAAARSARSPTQGGRQANIPPGKQCCSSFILNAAPGVHQRRSPYLATCSLCDPMCSQWLPLHTLIGVQQPLFTFAPLPRCCSFKHGSARALCWASQTNNTRKSHQAPSGGQPEPPPPPDHGTLACDPDDAARPRKRTARENPKAAFPEQAPPVTTGGAAQPNAAAHQQGQQQQVKAQGELNRKLLSLQTTYILLVACIVFVLFPRARNRGNCNLHFAQPPCN